MMQAPQEPPKPGMSADQSAAALSFATMLSEQMMPQAPVEEAGVPTEAPVSPESAPQEAQPAQEAQPTATDPNEAKIAELESKMETMRAEMEAMVKGEISGVKDIIIESLKDDGQQE